MGMHDGNDWVLERPVGWFRKSICALLSLAIFNVLAIPLVQAQTLKRQQHTLHEAVHPDPAGRYASGLEQLESKLANAAPVFLRAADKSLSPYVAIRRQLDEAAQALRQEWAKLHHIWEKAAVAAELHQRQQAMEAAFEARHAQLMAQLQTLIDRPDDAQARTALQSFVQTERPHASHFPVQLDKLPWQVEPAKPQTPASSTETPQKPLADAAPRAKAHTAPTAADLAPTLEAPHTDAIKALAHRLENNPYKIYQWVHDNIHYFPSHGSVQGAQDTLDKKRGNAFDTASLLIALLRSSGIAARYVYGTVEIPVEQVQNWVGGVATASAAQQLLSQGGVPSTIHVQGGKMHAFRLEHVWVEALIQYHPGRGARHRPGHSQPDSWIPMDGSFKQYIHAPGMDLQTAVPFDVQAFMDAARKGAIINEAEGWIQNPDSSAIQTRLQNYQSQLENYIKSQNSGNSSVGDVLGTRKIIADALPYLAGTLPYKIQARSTPFSEIPAHYRAQFQYAIYPDHRAAAWGDTPLLRWQAPTATIAGKKITLAWVAASDADRQAIEALIPAPVAGQPLDPAQLPTGLPASIHLQPEIRLDGKTVATGAPLPAGAEPIGVGGFTRYGSTEWDSSTDQLIAGQQTALGISVQGISAVQLEALKGRMQKTKGQLKQAQAATTHSQREQILRGLTGENLAGDLLTASIWAWFASQQSYAAIAGAQAQVIDLPGLQYALFHAQVQPRKLYGIVTTGITFKGVNLDAGHVRSIRWVKDDNPRSPVNSAPQLSANGKSAAHNRWIAYNKSKGQYASALEHAVPEEFWVDKTQCRYTDRRTGQIRNPASPVCAEGISAVKAIAIAQAQGQRIYTINRENRATALPKLPISGNVGAQIRSAIDAGKEVTFHESPIQAHGWSGYGYTIVDPDTGAGSYLIEGQGNGGFIFVYILKLLGLFYAVFLNSMTASFILVFPLVSVLGVLAALAACSFDVSNAQGLYINSIALLLLAISAIIFILPTAIFISPALGVFLSVRATIDNPSGHGNACRYVGL